MTIQLPHPLKSAADDGAKSSRPFTRLRAHLHTQGRSLIACLEFVADDAGTAAGYMLIDEARRANAWTRAIDRRVARVRGLLMLEHLESDDDGAIPAPDLFDDLDGEAVHACCRHADLLGDLQHAAAQDGVIRTEPRSAPLRPAMRPALPPRAAPTPRRADAAAAGAVSASSPWKDRRTV